MWGSKQATAATTALAYITVGALAVVWSIIWYIYLYRNGAHDNTYLLCYGVLTSGLVLVGIGLAVGPLGRAAKEAETPATPQVATAQTVQTDQTGTPVQPTPVQTVPVQTAPVQTNAPVNNTTPQAQPVARTR